MMNRRTFLCGLTLGTLTAPLAVEAQQAGSRVPRVGLLLFGDSWSPASPGREATLPGTPSWLRS